jgi:hypothetical protein
VILPPCAAGRGLAILSAALLFSLLVPATPAWSRDPIRIEYREVSCVGDNCTVRLQLTNQTREPIDGIVLDCVAQKGLKRVMARDSIEVSHTLYPGEPQVIRFGMDIPGSPTVPPDRVLCSVIFSQP